MAQSHQATNFNKEEIKHSKTIKDFVTENKEGLEVVNQER